MNHTEINHRQHMLHFEPPAFFIEWSSLSLVNLPSIKIIDRFMKCSTYLDWDQNCAAFSRVLSCIRWRLEVRIQLSSYLPGEAAIAWRSKCIRFLANNERVINTTSFIHLVFLLHSSSKLNHLPKRSLLLGDNNLSLEIRNFGGNKKKKLWKKFYTLILHNWRVP